MNASEFYDAFQTLTSNPPFPWQEALYNRFLEGDVPASCNLPTGLGKTSVIPIWLIALASATAPVPRRLVYIVNRRTVVDQATREAEKMRSRLLASDRPPVLTRLVEALAGLAAVPHKEPLAISTLRGQFADNGQWWKDPARPAVIVGTIDMIGSRLLFSGYRAGFKYRPLYAGFLGQDALIVHDEAHLEPAFQCLLARIEKHQNRRRASGNHRPCDIRPARVMELTATSRRLKDPWDFGEADQQDKTPPFGLSAADERNETVRRRIHAKKGVRFHTVEDDKKTADKVAELALRHKDSGKAVLVFLRRLQDVTKAADRLRKAGQNVCLLTGTIRGYERDRLVRDPVFARFQPQSDRPDGAATATGTVYLVCTSAGEVGVNISADHLVCDLTPFDSMAQRFGRVNRFGDGDALIDVVHPQALDESKEYEQRRRRTLALLQALRMRDDGLHNASPSALGDLSPDDRVEAFTPLPEILHAGDILFDSWALTSVRKRLPGRPAVADWLHGVDEGSPPETYVAWREEVQLFQNAGLSPEQLDEILADYPLKPQELLRDSTERILETLEKLAEAGPDMPAWLVPQGDDLAIYTLQTLVAEGQGRLANATVILSPSAGGLTKEGTFTGGPGRAADVTHDVADKAEGHQEAYRQRKTIPLGEDERPPQGWRLVRRVILRKNGEEGEEGEEAPPEEEGGTTGPRVRLFFVKTRLADDQGSTVAPKEQELKDHLERIAGVAEAVAARLGLPVPLRTALTLAARWHDLGKDRAVWQRSIGNDGFPDKVLAKSGFYGPLQDRSGYRHEFGSLIDVMREPEFINQPEEVRELVLHLIAVHHGRGRPHFDADEAFDPNAPDAVCRRTATEVPRRYARLQREYGRWGLAWLESLLRAADAYASAHPTENE